MVIDWAPADCIICVCQLTVGAVRSVCRRRAPRACRRGCSSTVRWGRAATWRAVRRRPSPATRATCRATSPTWRRPPPTSRSDRASDEESGVQLEVPGSEWWACAGREVGTADSWAMTAVSGASGRTMRDQRWKPSTPSLVCGLAVPRSEQCELDHAGYHGLRKHVVSAERDRTM